MNTCVWSCIKQQYLMWNVEFQVVRSEDWSQATFHGCKINRYTAFLKVDVDHRDTEVMHGVRTAKTEAMWAERLGARPTELDFIARFYQKLDFLLLTTFLLALPYEYFWFCCFSQIAPKTATKTRRTQPQCTPPHPTPPPLFCIDFLHNRHFNWNTLFFNIHLQHNSNLSHIDCGWISTWCRVSLIHRHF